MAAVFVMKRDSDDQIVGVFRESPRAVTGCTVYEEDYEGSIHWNNPDTPVYRDGDKDYRIVDNSGE
jgi:hypothetical protein